jgi:flagellar biosynthesis/type III secretory pathway protein FliH
MNNLALLKKIYNSKTRTAQIHTLTDEELIKEKDASYAEGFDAGRNDATLESTLRQETMQRELTYNLQLAVDKCVEEQKIVQDKISDLVLNLSVSLFKKTFPIYANRAGLEEVTHFIETQVAQLQELPELIIYVHPAFVDNVKSTCERITSETVSKLTILVKENPDLGETDCMINWQNGHVEKLLSNIIDDLSSLIIEPNSETLNQQE